MDRKYGNILGINVNSTSKSRVLTFVRSRLAGKRKFYIVTPNPEIVLKAVRDKRLAKIINSADLAIADGVGLTQAAKFLSMTTPKNSFLKIPFCFFQGLWVGLATFFDRQWLFKEMKPIKGREMFIELVVLANKKRWKVFLFGGEHREAQETARKLERNYKRVKIRFAAGPVFSKEGQPISVKDREGEKEVIDSINEFRPHLLFVALETPKQEKWIGKWLPKLSIGGAMVVGGTFRYIAGQAPLPPKWMEGAGLEWVWRLLTEPYRLRRILNAWPIFPLTVFWHKVNSK